MNRDIKDKEYFIKVFNAMEVNKIITDIEEEQKEKEDNKKQGGNIR